MIFNIKNTQGKKVKVFDPLGNIIKSAVYYCAITREVRFLANSLKYPTKIAIRDGKPIIITAIWENSWIEVDGVRY